MAIEQTNGTTQETNNVKGFEKIARKNFEAWNDALQTRDPEKVAGLYIEGAVFLPTLLGEIKIGKEGAKEYFEHFLKKNPFGKIIQGIVIPGETSNSYLYVGDYNFEVDSQEAESGRVTVLARFTFNYIKDGKGDWKINHHHSSLMPEK